MFTFFTIVRVLRAAFLALRAAAGIPIIEHGVYRLPKNLKG
jgi:hypothetical protein